ncbi:MAG: amidohydrolase family protein [Pseudomonadota bacterium]
MSLDPAQADRDNVAIMVSDGIITAIVDAHTVPDEAITYDVTGLYALPGLIDTHIHVATPPDRAKAEKDLQDMLLAGVTTARSMADDLRAVAELSRRAYTQEIASPDIVYAALFAGPTFMQDPRVKAVTAGLTPGDIPWMRRIDETTNLPDAVTQARGSGATGIKIYADLTAQQVADIAAEARRQGIPTWAHAAVYPAGPDAVAAAGVTTMSHACSLAHLLQPTMPTTYHSRELMPDRNGSRPLPDALTQTFADMKKHDTVLDATAVLFDWLEGETDKPSLCSSKLSADMTRLAAEHGVRISTGTDFKSDTDEPTLHREMRFLHEAVGLTQDEVWIAATRTGAEIVGQGDRLGVIASDYLANMLFFEEDPTADLDALDTLSLVVKRGEITRIE